MTPVDLNKNQILMLLEDSLLHEKANYQSNTMSKIEDAKALGRIDAYKYAISLVHEIREVVTV